MNTGAKQIIHIEDRKEDVELVKRILEKECPNAAVISLEDSEQVIEEIRSGDFMRRRPDLLLIDIKMPKISGLELLEELNGRDEYKRVPKVIFSSSTHPTDLKNAYNYNANSYIEKPNSYSELKNSLLTAVNYWLNLNLS